MIRERNSSKWWLCAVALVACADPLEPAPPPPPPGPTPVPASTVLRPLVESLGPREELWRRFCERNPTDRITRYFCQTPRPNPRGLRELLTGLGLSPGGANVHFTLTANSTALGLRAVNPLNPRAIVFDGVPREWNAKREFVALGYTRGEQVLELATRDEASQQLEFFVVMFDQACNQTACTLTDLLTERVERNWTALVPIHEADLRNTVADCRHCHQPGGPGTAKFLRMQELSAPWTHFWNAGQVAGRELIADFDTAHPASEGYAGIAASQLRTQSEPGLFSSLVAQEGGKVQPNPFDSFPIALELEWEGKSATWEAVFQQAVAGAAIPVPFWGLRVTEPSAQAAAAAAYRRIVEHGSDEPMPDLRALLSEQAERAMSVRPVAGADGRALLNQLCRRCHNSRLDPNVSRARFNVDALAELTADEKAEAVKRLRLARNDLKKMPPLTSAELSEAEIAALETALH